MAKRGTSVEIRDVFRDNFWEEGARLLQALNRHNTIALDTEFPGFLHNTPREADEERRYRDLKSNVERTRLIQLGLTVLDPATGHVAGAWQFNMAGFDPTVHEHAPESVPFLETHGIDFARNLADGVRMWQLVDLLSKIRRDHGGAIQWVTFHGLYDVAYLVVAVTGNRRLPCGVQDFGRLAGEFFCGGIFDLKLMAGEEFKYLGLERIAEAVGETREQGRAHTAGSDSLLTAKVFVKAFRTMKDRNGGQGYSRFKGLLYGLSVPVGGRCYGGYPVYRTPIALMAPVNEAAAVVIPRRVANYGLPCYYQPKVY